MLARTMTDALVGLEPRLVEVKAHLQRGVPSLHDRRAGRPRLPGGERRVRNGIDAADLEWPLAADHGQPCAGRPGEEGRASTSDPLALLAASGQIPSGASPAMPRSVSSRLTVGFARSPASLAVAEGARRAGMGRLICAAESARGGGARRDRAGAFRHLAEAVAYLAASSSRSPLAPPGPPGIAPAGGPTSPMSADRSGHAARSRSQRPAATTSCSPVRLAQARRCSLAGSPGSCRSSSDEALEVTRIHSVAGSARPPGWPLVRVAAVSRAAPHRVAGRDRRRRARAAARRGEPRASRRLLLDELPEFSARRSRRCVSRSRMGW